VEERVVGVLTCVHTVPFNALVKNVWEYTTMTPIQWEPG
jgi:hypothetical protein